MSARDDRRRRGLSAEDRALWTHVTDRIAPLRDKPVTAGAAEPDPAPPPVRARAPKTTKTTATSARLVAPKPPSPPPLAPLERRMKKRVARGKQAIDARLDLHGHTQSEAHSALLRFLRGAGARDARLVLVITGKSGVLRQQVPNWLGLPEFRSLVIGFEPAHVAHGGDGALYLRVRRDRT